MNPNLGQNEKKILEEALKVVKVHIKRIDNLFEPYGGIEKWKKK
ncbi:MAG: hypothetical protein Q4B86_05660 [Eubacteriales bacterium]|nr:hypothetical protein [Eubacteriales bacterium]